MAQQQRLPSPFSLPPLTDSSYINPASSSSSSSSSTLFNFGQPAMHSSSVANPFQSFEDLEQHQQYEQQQQQEQHQESAMLQFPFFFDSSMKFSQNPIPSSLNFPNMIILLFHVIVRDHGCEFFEEYHIFNTESVVVQQKKSVIEIDSDLIDKALNKFFGPKVRKEEAKAIKQKHKLRKGTLQKFKWKEIKHYLESFIKEEMGREYGQNIWVLQSLIV